MNRATAAQKEIVTRYADALRHYRAQRFEEAIAIWDELTASYEPAPSPSSVMSARSREFVMQPPCAPWDAVQVFTTK